MVNPKLNAHAVFRATEHAPILAAPYNQFKVRAFSRFYARARIFGDAFTGPVFCKRFDISRFTLGLGTAVNLNGSLIAVSWERKRWPT